MRASLAVGAFALCIMIGAAGAAQENRLEALRAEARAQSRDAEVQTRYGTALLRAGRYAEAERQLQAAARLQRGSEDALYRVAEVAFARGDYRAARRSCGALERVSKTSLTTRVCRARAFLVWNRSGRALEELESVLAESPAHFEALVALGDAHRLLAATTEAEEAYRRAATQNPRSPKPLVGLGRLYVAAGRREDAIRAYTSAEALDAEDPELEFELGRLLGIEGRTRLEAAAAGRPTWAPPQVALGLAELAAGNPSSARTRFEAAIRLDSRSTEAHEGLGRTYLAERDFARAEQSFQRALELVPNSPSAVLALGELYEATERNEEAFEKYQQAADLDTRSPEALLHAARLAMRLSRDVLAAGYLDRLLTVHPDHGPALELYGDVMRARRDVPAARGYYDRALRAGGVDVARVRASMAALAQPAPRRRPLR